MKSAEHYQKIAAALPLLAPGEGESWKEAAAQVGWTPYYFRRLFKQYAGISPRQYIACLALSDIKRRLREGDSVLEAAWAAGLSGGGRAHDLFIAVDAMTPGNFRNGGSGMTIDYGMAASCFGAALVAATEHGIYRLHFLTDNERDLSSAAWRTFFAGLPNAHWRRDDKRARRLLEGIFSGEASPLHVRGTNFQINVWRALLAIPVGQAVSYQALAKALTGAVQHTRAVARAVATNPVAVAIPCHRVISKDGRLTGYAWGVERKRALLAREFAVNTMLDEESLRL